MLTSTPQEVAIDDRGHVEFTCPYCRISRIASVARYRDLHAPITIECDCEQLFDILVDTRQFYRQHLQLPGTCIPPGSSMPQHITVETLSASGVSFHTIPTSSIQIDDELVLWFELDDIHETVLRLMAIVRWMQDETIGAEFCERGTYEQVLGSYLRSVSGNEKA